MEPCTYCGIRPGITRDHVPPQGIFPTPKPIDLITVPCCEVCRLGQSRDDEYFRTMIVMREDVAEHPAAAKLLAPVQRSFARPQNRGFVRKLLKGIKAVDVRTPAGLILGRRPAYDVDLGRLSNVIKRTTLGLFYHHYGRRLPSTHGCDAFSLAGFPDIDQSLAINLTGLIDIALSGDFKTLGGDTFVWAHKSTDDDPLTTVWILLVYRKVGFVSITCPLAHL